MKKIELSSFLESSRRGLTECRDLLLKDFDYVSFLGTDTSVLTAAVDSQSSNLGETPWVERGFVCRLQRDGILWEYSFNQPGSDPAALARKITEAWKEQEEFLADEQRAVYNPLNDEPLVENWSGEVERNPFTGSVDVIFRKLTSARDEVLASVPHAVFGVAVLNTAMVNKIFISPRRNLSQSYIWSEGYVVAMIRKGSQTRQIHRSVSGLKGLEMLDEYKDLVPELAGIAEPLLDAGSIVPGEYDVILSPSVSGVLAHEAFGHGVETDMFVRERALAREYLGKKVASDLVNMHDGARGASHVASYLFDDEGNGGTDQLVIEKGILKTGFGDELSLQELGIRPTGNGRRESYKRKAYARMTNTWFAPGKDNLDDMIASVKKGYLIESFHMGMEDPKNWGIQLVSPYGREIIDGKLTGKMVAPVLLTGFVPDVLKNISMVSGDFELEGAGACGKGYKERAKVSSGGPYLKTRMRLG